MLSLNLQAQQSLYVSGTIKNDKGQILTSATVFIDGSDRYTKTDADGNYRFNNLKAGAYTIAVSMIG
ncbi:carboxypeptidase-like regulatory domain-containing protein [Mucilaginibacter antarcticus]